MQRLQVNEIFYSLQGEGIRAGEPSIFIRLTGCNLKCTFCDTNFSTGNDMGIDEILKVIEKYLPCKTIVWTGGEPTLQLTNSIVKFFKEHGYYQCIETNGTNNVPNEIDFISLSPKVPNGVIENNFPKGVDEIRYVIHAWQTAIPDTKIKAKFYFLSPVFLENTLVKENLNNCIQLCLRNPKWRLSIQQHKIWQLR